MTDALTTEADKTPPNNATTKPDIEAVLAKQNAPLIAAFINHHDAELSAEDYRRLADGYRTFFKVPDRYKIPPVYKRMQDAPAKGHVPWWRRLLG